MKNVYKLLIVCGLFITLFEFGTFNVQAEKETFFKEDVKLTDEQKEELDALYQEIITLRKGVIDKYQEYGVLEDDKAAKMKQHMDKFYEKLKKDEFIPKWDKKHKHHKHDED